jgi:hypothetical protein
MFIDSSVVVYPVAGCSVVWIAHPKGPSARIATAPAVMRPCGLCNHPVIGITNVALPTPTSVRCIPVKRPIGGRPTRPETNKRSCSIPESPSHSRGNNSP